MELLIDVLPTASLVLVELLPLDGVTNELRCFGVSRVAGAEILRSYALFASVDVSIIPGENIICCR